MASILDAIRKKNMTKQTAETGPSSQSVSELIRTRRTGKAQDVRGPEASSTRQQMQTYNTQTQLDRVGAAGQQQAENIEAAETQQQQNIQQARETGELKADQVAENLRQTEQNILQEFERGQKSLNTAKAQADLEQVGFSLRLQNKQYIDELRRTGTANRMQSELGFREETYRTNFNFLEELFGEKMDLQSIMNADEREFNEMMSSMVADWDVQKTLDNAKAQNLQNLFGAVGTAGANPTVSGKIAGAFSGGGSTGGGGGSGGGATPVGYSSQGGV